MGRKAKAEVDLYPRDKKGLMRKTFTVNGKRYAVRAKTNKELFEKEEKKRAELEKIDKGIEEIHNPTLDEYYKNFTEIRRSQVRESTIRGQKSQYVTISNVVLKNGVRFGDLKIRDITRGDIELARQILLNEGKTPENLNICFAHLNHVLHNADIDDTIIKNPCKELKRLKRSKEEATKNKHRALTIEETEKFFKAARDRNSFYYNVFEFMIRTGMRIGEVGALYSTDIDKKNGFIHIRRTITRDEVGGYMVGDDTKTDSGCRDIPTNPEILSIIDNQKCLNRSIWGLQWSGVLFKSSDGNLLREYTLNREIKRICKDANIDYFTSHAFRDTYTTRYIEQRPQDFKILSEILGHKDVSITLNLYAQVMTEQKVISANSIMIKTS